MTARYEEEFTNYLPQDRIHQPSSSDDDESMEDEIDAEDKDNAEGQQANERLETQAESNPIAQDVRVVELGREKDNEQLLNKYMILHCAKLHMTVTDASSGDYIPNFQKRM